MKKELIVKLHQSFDSIANEKNGVEYWLARELQNLLEYTEWRNFLQVVEKAKTACLNAGQAIPDHFVDVNKMVVFPQVFMCSILLQAWPNRCGFPLFTIFQRVEITSNRMLARKLLTYM